MGLTYFSFAAAFPLFEPPPALPLPLLLDPLAAACAFSRSRGVTNYCNAQKTNTDKVRKESRISIVTIQILAAHGSRHVRDCPTSKAAAHASELLPLLPLRPRTPRK